MNYPVQLGLAYLFLAGYMARTIFVALRLPASVGVLLSGFAFSYCAQEEIHDARDYLQELAFFLVLLTAGLDISLADLKPYIFIMAVLPPSVELIGIATYGVYMLEFSWLEGLVLGTTLFAVGDGLVIPKMKEFEARFQRHPLPHMVFVTVPLEASYALVLFGILQGLSIPTDGGPTISQMAVASVLRIVATLVVAAFIGIASARLIERRTEVKICGNSIFSDKSVEAFLMLISATLFAFALGAGERGSELVPMSFAFGATGSLFLPEMMVIITGAFFSDYVSDQTLHKVEGVLGGVWVFGQIVLFSMLGSKTNPQIFAKIPDILPIILVGLACRLVGNALTMVITLNMRQKKGDLGKSILFCFLASVPRATIQGALGQLPLHDRFFKGDEHNWKNAEGIIGMASKIYIVVLAIVGMLMLNTFGPQLLEADTLANDILADNELSIVENSCATIAPKTPLEALAEKLKVDLKVLEEHLQTCEIKLAMPQSPQNSDAEKARKFISVAHAVHQFDMLQQNESSNTTYQQVERQGWVFRDYSPKASNPDTPKP